MPKGDGPLLPDHTSGSCSDPPRMSIYLIQDKPGGFHNTQTAAQTNTNALPFDRRKPAFLVTQASFSRPQRTKSILNVAQRIDGGASSKSSSCGDVHDPSHKMDQEFVFSPINKQLIQCDHVINIDRVDCFDMEVHIHCNQGRLLSMNELEMGSQVRRQGSTRNPPLAISRLQANELRSPIFVIFPTALSWNQSNEEECTYDHIMI